MFLVALVASVTAAAAAVRCPGGIFFWGIRRVSH